MKPTLITNWTIGDICKGFQYNEYEGKGLYGLSGKLTIQPEFQRHYLYAENAQIATGDLKGHDVKLCVGASFETKTGLFASLRYNLGTSDLAKNFPCKVSAINVTVGYKFNIFKF